jgi:hypothetical protein
MIAPPVATAHYGHAELQLLGTRRLAFVSRPGAAPRVLAVHLPARAGHPALGLDAGGRLTALVDGAGGLYRTRVTGTPRLRHVSGTNRGDRFPSLFRGRTAYDHGATVRTRALDGGPAVDVWSREDWAPLDTAIGAGGAVAFVAVRDGSGNGAFQLGLARPGRPVRRLSSLPLGDTHTGTLAIDGVDAAGRRLTVTRRLDGAVTRLDFSLQR